MLTIKYGKQNGDVSFSIASIYEILRINFELNATSVHRIPSDTDEKNSKHI